MYTTAGGLFRHPDLFQTSQSSFLVVIASRISSKLPMVGRERTRVLYRDIRLRVVVICTLPLEASAGPRSISNQLGTLKYLRITFDIVA